MPSRAKPYGQRKYPVLPLLCVKENCGVNNQVDILSLQDVPRVEYGEMRLSSMSFKLPELKERFRSYDLISLHGPVPTFSDVFLLWGLRGLGPNRPQLVYTYHAPVDLHNFLWQTANEKYDVDEPDWRADHLLHNAVSQGRTGW